MTGGRRAVSGRGAAVSRESLVVGLHPVQVLLKVNPRGIVALWLDGGRQDRRVQTLAQAAESAGVALHWGSREELDRLAGGRRHQGAVARVRPAISRNEADLERLLVELTVPPLLLILDGVQDPHNLGACLRTADGVGAHAVVAPRDRACGLTATVRKVASGAAETVPFVQVTNLARTLDTLRNAGLHLVGAAGEGGVGLYEADLRGPLGLVLGAEGTGLRRLTRERCDVLVRIPMAGAVDSLNVSVAAGVFLYEALRQRAAA